MIKLLLLFVSLYIPSGLWAQQNENWDLLRCVDYAMENNISVKQADVQARLQALQAKLSKGNRIPSLAFSSSGGYQFGRSLNPTTYSFTNNRIFQQTYNLQSGITLFNWFSIKNTIKSDQASADAAEIDINRAKNDVKLNVAAAYLQLLLSIEQINNAKNQIELTTKQLQLTRKQVDAGSLPELSAAQFESQLATDSGTYYTNFVTMQQNKLQLMALLNLSADADFDVSTPDVDKIKLLPIGELEPNSLFETAVATQYQQKVDSFKVKAAGFAIKSAKAAMYPTLSLFGNVGSNFSNIYTNQVGATPYIDTIGAVNVQGNNYFVTAPYSMPIYKKPDYFKQIFNLNLNQSVGLTLNVPIFNYRQLRTNYERSKLNLKNAELTQALNKQTLQQNIYTAYTNAIAGIKNFNASTKAAEYSNYAYELSQKRYDIGMQSTSDYLIQQNNLFQANVKKVSAHYEYIFRLLVLEFYKNNQISLY